MKNNYNLYVFTALLLSVSPTAMSYAQTVRETTAAGAPAETISLDPITVTATRGEKQVLDVPGTVTVIPRAELDERMTRDIQDLVRYQPGVSVNRITSGTDPFGNYEGFNIRGVGGNRVQMQVDGSRVIERITDGNRNFVDMPFLKSVEIVRGPGSVLWGADALGGIVAFRTLDPQDLLKGRDKPYAVKLDANYDSFNHAFTKTGTAAFRLTPTLEAIFGLSQTTAQEGKLSRARADGGRWGCPVPSQRYIGCDTLNPLDSTVWNAFGKLVFKPTTDHTFKLTGEYFDNSSTVNQLWDYDVVSSGIRNGPYLRDEVKSRQRIALEHQWDVGASFLDSIRWQASFSPQKRDVTNSRLQTLANGQQRFTRGILDYSEKFSQLDIQAKSSFALGPTSHKLTYGFQGDITSTDYERRDDVRNMTTGVTTTTIAGGFNFANATTTRYDFFLQDEIELLGGRWTITPGVRYANYKIDPSIGPGYVIVPGKEPREIESHKLIPQVGTLFKLDDTYSLYARYAQGFKMPTAQQLYTSLPFGNQNLIPNPDLKPETVNSYEAGFRGRFENGWFSVGVFHADYKDFIQNFVTIPGTTDLTYRNLASVKISGIEASAEWKFHERWIGNVALSYQYGTQQTEAGALTTPYNSISPLTAVTALKYLMPEYGLEAEFIGTFGSAVTRASAPTIFKAGGYSVFDTFLNWKPTSFITVRGGVQNIFDKRYFSNVYNFDKVPASAAVAATNPLELQTAPGRTFKLAASVEF
ncbi:MAG TPA: TonB-dependent hemoglobin/transferrin/lactoferrin family receptor [Bosea sp. (in: a-proteobacteria)]|jgi:hemoglobin/transferrin/lactoferrin receptor protein|uniref:TonB-dependent hemoglobin/transferrin/lactoferrin family receptor n=1 Tax=Bosea sp. (in: a-proteobacteria) TaxID=1871050 RepID=UPI002E13EBC5|nr:TonB-dependent hemoglobin/transferrin/lactoferrin family receptor [Bosea sp. (in: a-proteobacteria)]